MSMLDNFWGNLIRQLREGQGISQRVLSARVSVNRSTLRKIENGETDGDISTVERILDYLGYDLEALERDGQAARMAELAADPKHRSELAALRVLKMRLV